MDKLRAITLFCTTVEAKSFAAAAQRLGIVPSALSKAITSLEGELGFSLMHRSTRRLALTDEGALYYDQCRQLLQGLEEAETSARKGHTVAAGTLRIGFHPSLRSWLLGRLGPFLQAHPELKLETVITNSPAAILEDGLDMVLRIGRPADSSLVARQIGATRSIVCASPAYVAAWGRPHSPEDLVHHRAIVYARRDEEPNTRWEFMKDRERRTVTLAVRLVVRDGIGLTDAAMGGYAIARPFDFAVRDLLEGGRLLALLPEWTSDPQPLYAVVPGRPRTAPTKVRAWIEFLESTLSQGGFSK